MTIITARICIPHDCATAVSAEGACQRFRCAPFLECRQADHSLPSTDSVDPSAKFRQGKRRE